MAKDASGRERELEDKLARTEAELAAERQRADNAQLIAEEAIDLMTDEQYAELSRRIQELSGGGPGADPGAGSPG
jgi:hypothetical protein